MFGLTPEERRVMIFLFGLALSGISVNFLAKKISTVKNTVSISQDIGKIDLNKADKEALMSVRGIGEKLAQRIIEYRDTIAEFKEMEELKNIRGITNYRYGKIKDSLTIK